MLGIGSDNDSTFMSRAVFDYCKGRGLKQTRSRPYTTPCERLVAHSGVEPAIKVKLTTQFKRLGRFGRFRKSGARSRH